MQDPQDWNESNEEPIEEDLGNLGMSVRDTDEFEDEEVFGEELSDEKPVEEPQDILAGFDDE